MWRFCDSKILGHLFSVGCLSKHPRRNVTDFWMSIHLCMTFRSCLMCRFFIIIGYKIKYRVLMKSKTEGSWLVIWNHNALISTNLFHQISALGQKLKIPKECCFIVHWCGYTQIVYTGMLLWETLPSGTAVGAHLRFPPDHGRGGNRMIQVRPPHMKFQSHSNDPNLSTAASK